MAKTNPVLSEVIQETADGANVVVAAVAGKKIRVLGYAISINAAGTITWNSGVTPLSGVMEFVDGGGLVCPLADPTSEVFWFETAVGAALNLTCAAGVDGSGHITYQLA